MPNCPYKAPVLVIDDEAVSRRVVCTTLEKSGYEIREAADGAEGLRILKSSSCQMVVTDWEMPGVNGLELCRSIRNGAVERYVYVLMLTGHNRPNDVVEGLEAGADDFVTKPFNPIEIAVRVRAGMRLLALDSAEMTIFAMARLAESRDPETGEHLERVRAYCRLLGESLQHEQALAGQIDDEFVRLLYQTSPLHDIGKVGLPDRILLKPGRLTDAEFAIMKTHTTRGAATLDAAIRKFPSALFLQMARDISLTHHERYDGTGYPSGLRGEGIPLSGRIMAVADVYDALTSKRVYKDAFPHSVAREMIAQERGTHFDPIVVDAFLKQEQLFDWVRLSHGVHDRRVAA